MKTFRSFGLVLALGLVWAGAANAQSAAVSIYSQAERIPLSLNVESITRARVVINNNASGTTQAIYSRIACITEL